MEEILEYQEGRHIWFTSDLHLGHDKEFIWKARGYMNVNHMNDTILYNLRSDVKPNDRLFILGDLMLGGADTNPQIFLPQLPKQATIILGNHDTAKREEAYRAYFEGGVFDTRRLRYKARDGKIYHFYLSHYPTLTANYDDEQKPLSARVLNLFGHTHQAYMHFMDSSNEINPYMFHVGVDSHFCFPYEIENIIELTKIISKNYEELKEKENKNA